MHQIWLASYGLAWLLVTAQLLLAAALLWALGEVHLRRDPRVYVLVTDDEGPPLHAPAPEFRGREIAGRTIGKGDYHGQELALLLLSPDCSPCDEVVSAISATQSGLRRPPEFLVSLDAPRREAEEYARRHVLKCPVLVDGGSVRARLGVQRTPYGLLIDADGIVRMKGVVNDRWQLESLVSRRGQPLGGAAWEPIDSDPAASAGSVEANGA